MKVGDYVRTIDGISKITDIRHNNKVGNLIQTEEYKYIWYKEREIIKTSPNIIDLIEAGDYVNGHKVVEVDLDDIDDYGNDFRYIKAEHDYTLNYWIKENEIESVLAKEQFESMEYRIGE